MDALKSDLLRNDIRAQLNFGFREEEIICNLKTKGHTDEDILAESDLFFSARKRRLAQTNISKSYIMMLIFSLLCLGKLCWSLLLAHSWNAVLIIGVGIPALLIHLFRKSEEI
ncbi:hypothetical protein F0919_12625 [Taibaiella lutea]|uniref:Uncharacterized protein n=1 Tax=Taibaiella lutea TaxID=2608001 RepID=A0A5M6CE64_9BACT|nr:hypothetical protein [Taibaiella lutea]KAA5533381.1 hypothetical protein F0919_12625 [Taibaiella lutea]